MPKTKAPLTEKQRRFVQRYLVHGNATQAAREAKYASPNVSGPKLVKVSAVAQAIAAVQNKATTRDVMQREEALEILSGLSRGKGAKQAKDRIAATALLGKLTGWEAPKKLEHSGPNGTPIGIQSIPVTREQALEQLRAEAAKNPELAAELKKVTGGES